MRKLFAIPTIGKVLCEHFGHSEEFAIVETEDQKVLSIEYFTPPEHIPGSYPNFLASKGVSTIIAGGMGSKARDNFARNNIEVFMGVGADSPEELVRLYHAKQLVDGDNFCDH